MTAQSLPVRHIDLSTTHKDTHGGDAAAFSVFWWKDLPLGMRASLPEELPFGEAQLRQFAAEFGAAQLAARSPTLGAPLRATFEGRPKQALILAHLLGADNLVDQLDRLAAPSGMSAQDISVVICTRDRGEALAGCLKSVTTQQTPPSEIIVVDNSVDGNAKSICRRFPEIRHVHEPRPGLSVARNAGIRASCGEIIAFTDDDVELHPSWTAEVGRAFLDESIDALTGLVLPAQLDTPAQRIFQLDMGGFGTTFVPLRFDHRFLEETRPHGAHVWKIGAGANMAFRRKMFERIGLFDERLGAGAAGCSEDSELWYRMLANGGVCLYEPRAVVFHHHRRELSELRQQMRSYMRGHVAALVAQYDEFGDRGNLVRIFGQLPIYFLRTFLKGLLEGRNGRPETLTAEVAGWTAGLQFLFRSGWRRQRAPRLSAGGAGQ
ncbi:glycosyltransferase [Pseudaminobacter sp. 19-2017]|uniref:Glycosyltransferase n=1 Tax=Pseudaminobacter soli (ex Zhang et al. 2022) TaxID=2831468 RepID=A0A942DUJ6_9HYPH|nr:glycosyltransferase [Pseudaminobacter soli]MBS3647229.1 glycosyltransferase [Pseudaminobacter soli]